MPVTMSDPGWPVQDMTVPTATRTSAIAMSTQAQSGCR